LVLIKIPPLKKIVSILKKLLKSQRENIGEKYWGKILGKNIGEKYS
jgi:hypothetical protein